MDRSLASKGKPLKTTILLSTDLNLAEHYTPTSHELIKTQKLKCFTCILFISLFVTLFWLVQVSFFKFNNLSIYVSHSSKHFKDTAAAAAAKSLQSCLTLCDPIDGSPPGSPVPGILQARTLEWVAISFSNAWKWKVKVKSLSRAWLLATPGTAAR